MRIKWSEPAEVVYNHIRGLAPFPGAWTELCQADGTTLTLKIFKTEKNCLTEPQEPGKIVTDGKRFLEICVRDGRLRILELQLSGKKRMGIEEFLRGFRLDDCRLMC